jgi:thymidylate synthase (FAD)
MRVELVHCTPNAENLIVDMARVSNPSNQGRYDTAPRLLRYLVKHEHWSPFQLATMCVRIETERDIAAQILRHRSFTFQEFSTRYSKTAPAEIPALRRQDHKNRQNSFNDLPSDIASKFEARIAELISQSFALYEEMLEADVAKETARRILPLCTPTVLYMHGSLRDWGHYILLRTKPDTQLEHREVAEGAKAIFAREFPVIAEALFEAEGGR